MDNFILYDEIYKTENITIYKGRRKGSINFVSIHCIEKILRPEITNLVRLTYEINHKNVVKFYEWYETSNHLWLVVELCTAGPLELILEQDNCFPESSIKQFGIDLCEGLFYVHSLGMLFCDLEPRKIMVDGSGNLKLSDFGYSKHEGEDLENIFQETFDSTSPQWSQAGSSTKAPKVYKKPFGDLHYIAPEVLLGEDNTQASDLWSLGCILYRMYTGSCPFVSEDKEHLKNQIINREVPNPKGNKLSTKPSNEFLSLLKGLLEKNSSKRLKWRQVLYHAFWEDKLKHLMPPSRSIIVDGKEKIVEADELDEADGDDRVNPLNFSRLSTDRPRTMGASSILEQKPEINVSFSISSRLPVSPQSTIQTRNPVQCKESDEARSSASTIVDSSVKLNETDKNISLNEYRRLFFLPSELNVSQIVDNAKIQKPSPFKFETKVLPFSHQKFMKADTLIHLPKDELVKFFETIKVNTNIPADKTAVGIKVKLNLMNYIGSLCCESSKIADSFVQIELYKELLNIVKNGLNLEMKMKAARVIAIMFNKASKLDPTKDFSDIMQNLVDVISANRKDVKFKQALMPALGEIVYLVSCQEMKLGKTIEIWTVPSLAYLLFIRSIGDDLVTNHIICKIIENVASTTSVNVKKFLSNQSELVNAVWSCYTHSANNEQLRIASLNALCMLTSHSTSIFSNLVDKVGADSVLDCLSHNNSHIQHPVLTMISMYLNDSNSKSLPEKKLISKLVSIYESTNVVCRAKAYLLTLVLLKQQNDLLSSFMQSKLIISIERDNKKNFTSKEENDYMHKIIGMLMELIIYLTTQLFDETLSLLEATYGRKNPSTTQTKQFKRCVPSMNNLKVFISNQGFRSKIVNIQFIEKFAQLIRLSKPVYESELNLDNICGGTGITADYINAIITILESIVQNIDTVGNNSRQIIKFIMPVLVENVNSQNSDIKVESLKIISELCSLYLNKQQMSQQQQQQQQQQQMAVNQPGQELKEDLKSYVETGLVDIWDQLLGQPEPIPFFTLNIFQCTLSYDITLINVLKVKNKLPSLVKYLQTNRTKIGSNVMVKLLNIFYLWSSTVDPFDLYENAIVEVLRSILIDLSKIKKYDDRIVSETLIEVLKIVDNLLKHVSEFVKKALQMKKLAGSSDGMAQQAEKLLHSNKPLIVCNQFMITLLISEDNDISELSCKILWVIMQLFGTESKDLITQENLNIFLNAIMNSNSKRQKILLRVLKRMITADKQNLEIFKSIGASFIENMKLLKNTANSEANVALATTIDEILKLI